RDVKLRFPCFATGTPAPATTNAAAVETLSVVTVPPPVPHVSTSRSLIPSSTPIIVARNADAAPVISSAVSPLLRRPRSSAAISGPVASPRMTTPKAAADSSADNESPAASRLRAWDRPIVSGAAVFVTWNPVVEGRRQGPKKCYPQRWSFVNRDKELRNLPEPLAR